LRSAIAGSNVTATNVGAVTACACFSCACLNVAVSLGRILRDRGIETTAGRTEVEACSGKSEADCFSLKRPGGPLDARINPPDTAPCDFACVLILVGGVHRNLPSGMRVILSGMSIHNRLAPNVSEERRQGLTALFGEQFRLYLRAMDVDTELLDLVDQSSQSGRRIEIPASEWMRLHLVTAQSL